MITKNDLSPNTRRNYLLKLVEIGKDETWGEVALNEKKLSDWETTKNSSFGLFALPSFQAQVDRKMSDKPILTVNMVNDDLQGLIKFVNELEERIIKLEEGR